MKDTLYFTLQSNEEKYSFKGNEILEQIAKQKHNFIEKFNYEPRYISIKTDIVDYLFKNATKTIRNIGYPNFVYGMKIKLRDDDIGLYSNEVICI